MEEELLAAFDTIISRQGSQSRCEAVRDLVQRQLSRDRISSPQAEAVAAICLVYDHHATKITERLIGRQHSHLLHAISSLHVHLDEHDGLEAIVLRGRVSEIISMKASNWGKSTSSQPKITPIRIQSMIRA